VHTVVPVLSQMVLHSLPAMHWPCASQPLSMRWSRSNQPGSQAPIAHSPALHAAVAWGMTQVRSQAQQLVGSSARFPQRAPQADSDPHESGAGSPPGSDPASPVAAQAPRRMSSAQAAGPPKMTAPRLS